MCLISHRVFPRVFLFNLLLSICCISRRLWNLLAPSNHNSIIQPENELEDMCRTLLHGGSVQHKPSTTTAFYHSTNLFVQHHQCAHLVAVSTGRLPRWNQLGTIAKGSAKQSKRDWILSRSSSRSGWNDCPCLCLLLFLLLFLLLHHHHHHHHLHLQSSHSMPTRTESCRRHPMESYSDSASQLF